MHTVRLERTGKSVIQSAEKDFIVGQEQDYTPRSSANSGQLLFSCSLIVYKIIKSIEKYNLE